MKIGITIIIVVIPIIGMNNNEIEVKAIYVQSNPDKVLASVLCQGEDFIRTRTLSGLTFCMCEVGLCNADP